MGAGEISGSCLLEIVVRMRRLLLEGMRSKTLSRSSVMDVVADRGSERVGGRASPGKDVTSTLTVDEAMMKDMRLSAGLCMSCIEQWEL
jgi:hypothetical protein